MLKTVVPLNIFVEILILFSVLFDEPNFQKAAWVWNNINNINFVTLHMCSLY